MSRPTTPDIEHRALAGGESAAVGAGVEHEVVHVEVLSVFFRSITSRLPAGTCTVSGVNRMSCGGDVDAGGPAGRRDPVGGGHVPHTGQGMRIERHPGGHREHHQRDPGGGQAGALALRPVRGHRGRPAPPAPWARSGHASAAPGARPTGRGTSEEGRRPGPPGRAPTTTTLTTLGEGSRKTSTPALVTATRSAPPRSSSRLAARALAGPPPATTGTR